MHAGPAELGRDGGAVGTSKWHFTNIEKISGIDIRQSIVPILEFLDPPSPWHPYYGNTGCGVFKRGVQS